MPRIESTVVVPVPPDLAFAVSQTQGEIRYRWDPFVRRQNLIDASRPARGVRTQTVSRHRIRMVSEYTSFRPPEQVGMKMVEGPWFFQSFGGGWSFQPEGEESTAATWRYTFTIRPAFLRPLADRIGTWLLSRDINRRIEAYAGACLDPVVTAAAVEMFRD